MRFTLIAAALCIASPAAVAKLPPLSEEAKAKAAEAAAKTAYGNKVADFKLCQSQDKVAAKYVIDARKAGKDMQPAALPACADPGPFVYAPTGAAPAASAAPAPAAPPAAAPAKKS